jgi:hypothetical protein
VCGWGTVLGGIVEGVDRGPWVRRHLASAPSGPTDLYPIIRKGIEGAGYAKNGDGDRSRHRQPHRPARVAGTPGCPRPRTVGIDGSDPIADRRRRRLRHHRAASPRISPSSNRSAQGPGQACSAAWLPAYSSSENGWDRLAADGIVGPVQWISDAATPQIGPAGAHFSHRYQSEHREPPDYVAATAAATGYLAAEAHRRRYQHHQIQRWKTTTLLGDFALDQSWRQVGQSPITIEWRHGRQKPAT